MSATDRAELEWAREVIANGAEPDTLRERACRRIIKLTACAHERARAGDLLHLIEGEQSPETSSSPSRLPPPSLGGGEDREEIFG